MDQLVVTAGSVFMPPIAIRSDGDPSTFIDIRRVTRFPVFDTSTAPVIANAPASGYPFFNPYRLVVATWFIIATFMVTSMVFVAMLVGLRAVSMARMPAA
jgi:hypothetical protein